MPTYKSTTLSQEGQLFGTYIIVLFIMLFSYNILNNGTYLSKLPIHRLKQSCDHSSFHAMGLLNAHRVWLGLEECIWLICHIYMVR